MLVRGRALGVLVGRRGARAIGGYRACSASVPVAPDSGPDRENVGKVVGVDERIPAFKVAVTGSSGMLGSALCKALSVPSLANRHNPVVCRMVRGDVTNDTDIKFLPDDAHTNLDRLERCDAVVNLAGEGMGLRLSERSKYRVFHSRRKATELLANAILSLDNPPQVVVSASGIGYYGNNRGDTVLDETSSPGDGFLADLAHMWEETIAPVRERGVRVVNARIGVVMSQNGGALAKMLPSFKMMAGGKLGSGDQWMSCISLTDVTEAIMFAIHHAELDGPVNFTCPNPVTNTDFTAALAAAVNRPAFFSQPEAVIRAVFGDAMAEETLLSSQRVVPSALLDAGFQFQHPTIADILRSTLHSPRGKWEV